jgi:predicted small metal-binding protein
VKSFRCGDVVPGCTRAFTGLDDDIMAQVEQHARRDHGLAQLSAELDAQIRANFVPVAA